MKHKQLDGGQSKTFALIFGKGDEFMQEISEFARNHKLSGSHFTAIGAFCDVTLGYFDRDQKQYKEILLHEQVEVLSLVGDVALKDGAPKVHAHVVVGKSDGTAHGGHLLRAHVWPTLEVVLAESPEHLRRMSDDETGLALIQVQP